MKLATLVLCFVFLGGCQTLYTQSVCTDKNLADFPGLEGATQEMDGDTILVKSVGGQGKYEFVITEKDNDVETFKASTCVVKGKQILEFEVENNEDGVTYTRYTAHALKITGQRIVIHPMGLVDPKTHQVGPFKVTRTEGQIVPEPVIHNDQVSETVSAEEVIDYLEIEKELNEDGTVKGEITWELKAAR